MSCEAACQQLDTELPEYRLVLERVLSLVLDTVGATAAVLELPDGTRLGAPADNDLQVDPAALARVARDHRPVLASGVLHVPVAGALGFLCVRADRHLPLRSCDHVETLALLIEPLVLRFQPLHLLPALAEETRAFQRRRVLDTLARLGGNISATARALQVARSYLYTLLDAEERVRHRHVTETDVDEDEGDEDEDDEGDEDDEDDDVVDEQDEDEDEDEDED